MLFKHLSHFSFHNLEPRLQSLFREKVCVYSCVKERERERECARERERERKSERGFRSFRVSLGKKRRLSENGKERGQHLSGQPTAFRGANDRWMLLLDASHLLSLNTVGLFRLSQQSWWPFLTVVMALESRQESENQPSRNHNKAEARQEPKEKEEDEDVNFLML